MGGGGLCNGSVSESKKLNLSASVDFSIPFTNEIKGNSLVGPAPQVCFYVFVASRVFHIKDLFKHSTLIKGTLFA